MTIKYQRHSIFTKLILICAVIAAVYIGQVVFFPRPIPNKTFRLIIEKNQSLSYLATDLQSNHIIPNRQVFLILLRVLGRDKKVTAGLYILKDSMSTWDLVARITNGHPDQISITILDGWSFKELKQYIDGIPEIKHLSTNLTEEELKNILKIDTPNLEGVFYPETYFIAPQQTDLEVYQQAYKFMQLRLHTLYLARTTNSYYINSYQLLIMASLIQKETASVPDMQLVSTVFNNRLKQGMKLQDDPAVFYGLHHPERVTRKDFQIDTPYNTYLHFGLPPTPICIPSEKALAAAAQPLNKPELLYFLAIGGGKTKFSTSYHEHRGLINHYLDK